jgi:hypothetical protein
MPQAQLARPDGIMRPVPGDIEKRAGQAAFELTEKDIMPKRVEPGGGDVRINPLARIAATSAVTSFWKLAI